MKTLILLALSSVAVVAQSSGPSWQKPQAIDGLTCVVRQFHYSVQEIIFDVVTLELETDKADTESFLATILYEDNEGSVRHISLTMQRNPVAPITYIQFNIVNMRRGLRALVQEIPKAKAFTIREP